METTGAECGLIMHLLSTYSYSSSPEANPGLLTASAKLKKEGTLQGQYPWDWQKASDHSNAGAYGPTKQVETGSGRALRPHCIYHSE
jgi:hypothetical protein